MIYIIIGLFIFSILATRNLKLVPGRLQSVMELFIGFFSDIVDESMGPKGKGFKSFVFTLALYIFLANVMGLIPGLIPPTANLNTPVALALIVFFTTHFIGIREHGIKYIKHFVGPVWALAALMIPIEIVGHVARPLSLSLRLFGNMMGHEQIVNVLLSIMPYAFPLLLLTTLLGIVVIFIQAFIFTLLSVMYFGSAIEEAH